METDECIDGCQVISSWRGFARKPITSNQEEQTRQSQVDRVFDACLLLITVIAAAELGYASSLDEQQLIMNIFRWTTIPFFVLIPLWIFLMLLPSGQLRFKGVENYFSRRYLKEFCWGFFANIFTLEISSFFALISTSAEVPFIVSAIILTSGFALFGVTFFAVYQYQKNEPNLADSHSRKYYLSILSLLLPVEIVLLIALVLTNQANIIYYTTNIALIVATTAALLYLLMDEEKRPKKSTKPLRQRLNEKILLKRHRLVMSFIEYVTIWFIGYVVVIVIFGASIIMP